MCFLCGKNLCLQERLVWKYCGKNLWIREGERVQAKKAYKEENFRGKNLCFIA